MTAQAFYDYMSRFGKHQQRSMFGGIGLFCDGAMFALVTNDSYYLRGGKLLDNAFLRLGCEKYRHVKKQTTAVVNYYDITNLYRHRHGELDELISRSIALSVEERQQQKNLSSRRLRDLPNMQLTLERMVKKSGIKDVETFMKLGPVAVFNKVKQAYGNDLDIKLLWKFAGAVQGVHWELLHDQQKQQLLEESQHTV